MLLDEGKSGVPKSQIDFNSVIGFDCMKLKNELVVTTTKAVYSFKAYSENETLIWQQAFNRVLCT